MGKKTILVWSGKSDGLYREARRQITAKSGVAPKTVRDLDFSKFFETDRDTVAYYPVFQNSNGWWGPLLGTDAKVRSKFIISSECQIYEIGSSEIPAAHKLFVVEVAPDVSFFSRLREIAAQIKDMIATDSGTMLALLVGNCESKIKNCVKGQGWQYFGRLGGY